MAPIVVMWDMQIRASSAQTIDVAQIHTHKSRA